MALMSRDSCKDFAYTFNGKSFGVDDTFDEAQIDWHQLFGVIHNEDALHVEFDAATFVAIHKSNGARRM